MENRLQFRHHTQIFETRQEAIDYIYTQIRYTDTGMAANDRSYGFSLFAEPTILRYKNEEDEIRELVEEVVSTYHPERASEGAKKDSVYKKLVVGEGN